jgi:SAM-dependent methyltransferase
MAPEARPASISAVEAMDAALAGARCHVLLPDGSARLMAASRWAGEPSASDVALFVDPCDGPTLDLGCGPGRLSGALAARGVDVLGVDISPEAVRQARHRGVPAVCQDVFAHRPGPHLWSHVLLADGNIGLGGRPVRLLERVADLMSPAGTALVELGGGSGVSVHHDLQLRVRGRTSDSFSWATVGAAAICAVAAAAGLVTSEVRSVAGRQVATLRHAPARPGRR